MSDIFAEIEKRIAVKKRELEEEERALAVLKRSMGQPITATSTIEPQNTQVGPIKFEDLLGSVQKTKKRTLIDEVRDAVSQFGSNEFTISHVDAALNKMGVVVDTKNPRARMSIALSKVLDEGFIVKTFEGAGNIPHRYKLKAAVDAESLV